MLHVTLDCDRNEFFITQGGVLLGGSCMYGHLPEAPLRLAAAIGNDDTSLTIASYSWRPSQHPADPSPDDDGCCPAYHQCRRQQGAVSLAGICYPDIRCFLPLSAEQVLTQSALAGAQQQLALLAKHKADATAVDVDVTGGSGSGSGRAGGCSAQ